MKNKMLLIIYTGFSILCMNSTCQHKHEKIYYVGDTWSFDGTSIKLDSLDYNIDQDSSTILIESFVIINTTKEYQINQEGVYVYRVPTEKFYTIVEKNIEVNGFDIMNISFIGKKQYTFFFEIPLDNFARENGEFIYETYGVSLFIDPASFLLSFEFK